MRDQFLLDPDVIFLNHGSFGACPRPVFEEYQRWQRELERQPVEFLGRRFNALMDSARAQLAAYLNAGAEDLIFTPNTTTGINIVARSLREAYLRPGDEILTTNHEYGAMDYTWEHVCKLTGAKYVRCRIPLPLKTDDSFVASFLSAITHRTRVIFISHISSPTALIFPITEVVQYARQRGCLTVIDGAHVPGHIPLNLRALDPDLYIGNLHKWLGSPKGAAFLYVRKDHQSMIEPSVISWGEPTGAFTARNQWQGTRDIASYLAVPAAIEFQTANQWDAVRARCHELAVSFWRSMEEFAGPPAAADDRFFAQMVTAPLPACDAAELKRRLYDEYRIEIPITSWNGQDLLRASFQGYNTRADLDALIAALRRLLPEVTRAGESA